jgi:hypothetical protein
MAWIIIEGLDRSGKSTVAEYYKKQGYEVVHMSAPDKKYFEKGYVGPSYLDELIELYMQHDGNDVVWDRSAYGEFVWPNVFGRKPKLLEEDLEPLQEFEYKNNAEYFLMYDEDKEAHWQRCEQNNEPITKRQFIAADREYEKLVKNYDFKKTQLHDFEKLRDSKGKNDPTVKQETETDSKREDETSKLPSQSSVVKEDSQEAETTEQQKKLQRANAINSILTKRIIKQRGPVYDDLERDIKLFLNSKLSNLFGEPTQDLTSEEINIVKLLCQRFKQKQ